MPTVRRASTATIAVGLGLAVVCSLIAAAPGSPGTAEVLAAAIPESNAACSLTKPKKLEAVLAWEAMMPVFRHPRCTNCHGGVNPAVAFLQGGHRGGAVTASTACDDCHSLLQGWRVPDPILHFTTKTNRELCIFIKRLMPQSPGVFVEHIEFEPGNPHFIKQAFLGDKALNTVGEVTLMDEFGIPAQREPPPGSHARLIQLATDWGRKVGRAWADSPECGCEIDGAWVGTVTAKGTFTGFGGVETMLVNSRADIVLDAMQTPSFASGKNVRNYRSISGTVYWEALALGNCRGGASGSLPLDTVDIDGNPMAELRLEEVGPRTLSYQPTTGSWPDRWGPIFTVQCNVSGTRVTLPVTNPLPTWWHWDVPNAPTTTDSNRIKGSYRWAPAPGSIVTWEWELERK